MSKCTWFSRSHVVSSILTLIFCGILLLTYSSKANANTIVVPPGGDIQAAINAAQFGDTIILQAGATYETPFAYTPYSLVNKGNGSGYITITSSIAPPADGTRVTLADRANMPKLVVKNGSSFFEALHGAHHFRLSGLWITNKQGGTTTQLLSINGQDIAHQDPRDPQVDWPHDIIIDHCWFNPVEWDMYPEANLCSSVNTAVGMMGINITIRDSMMKGFGAKYGGGTGSDQPGCGTVVLDGESVIVGTAPGPMLIDNNQLEEWFVAFFIGGGDPGSMYGGTVLSSPAPTLTSASLSNVTGLNVGDNIAFEMNVDSPTHSGVHTGQGTIQSIVGNSVTFTHLVGKWGTNDSYIPIPDGARPKTVDDAGGVAPCSNNSLGSPIWCSQAYWDGYVPSNITITHNYINKPTRWFNYAGSDGKGFFEMKLCDTCLIDGNIFSGKTGFTVTVRDQGGRAPWSVIKNLTISNNLATQFGAGLYTLFLDNEELSKASSNIVLDNNLMYGEFDTSSVMGFRPRVFSGTYGDSVRITHNTILQSGRIVTYGTDPSFAGIDDLTNFIFSDNIVGWGTSTESGYGCTEGDLSVCTPGYAWTRNAMIGAPTGPLYDAQSLASFPSGNFNPTTIADVGFTDPASGNYRLLSSSPYYRAASDGKDVGVDMDQLLAHLNGPIPVPSPTPTPTPIPSPIPTPTPTPTPSPMPTPTPTPTPTATPTPTPTPGPASATFVNLDTTTEGTWKGIYGSDGYAVVNDTVNYPSYAQVSVTNQSLYTWAASTTDLRALQKAAIADRIAATWYADSFDIDINLTDGQTHQVGVYCLDWAVGRAQRIDVLDAASSALLDSRNVSGFSNGQYLVWNVSGHVKLRVTQTAGNNAVVSGLFFQPTTNPIPTPTPTPPPPTPRPSLGNSLGHAKQTGQNLSNQLAAAGSSALTSGSNLSFRDQLASTVVLGFVYGNQQVSGTPLDQSITSALADFLAEIEDTYAIFAADRDAYPAASRIEAALAGAINGASEAEQASTQADLAGVETYLRQAITNLELSNVLITYGDVANPIDFPSYMVRQQYIDFLNREPDQSGDDFWINEITSCGTDAACVEVKRINVSAAFLLSIEFQQTGYYVYRLYNASYRRVPLRQEFLPDNRSISGGVIVGADGWEAKLAGNKQAFVQSWVQRADFQARYSGLTNEQYVDTLIANVGVTITQAERDGLVQDLVNGKSRADVLAELVENPTVTQQEFNSAFVLMQYFGYLQRDPDSAGFNFWLNKLNQFNGNFVDAEMVKAFLESTEYRQRFGQ